MTAASQVLTRTVRPIRYLNPGAGWMIRTKHERTCARRQFTTLSETYSRIDFVEAGQDATAEVIFLDML
jgi:hypothetical protein